MAQNLENTHPKMVADKFASFFADSYKNVSLQFLRFSSAILLPDADAHAQLVDIFGACVVSVTYFTLVGQMFEAKNFKFDSFKLVFLTNLSY